MSKSNNENKTKAFIEKARRIFGNKYDYSNVTYTNNRTKVSICCSLHGTFLQEPRCHLEGKGCPDCAPNKKNSLDKFVSVSRKNHEIQYDYSKSVYINTRSKVKIICPEHGEFIQQAGIHMRGSDCPKCAAKQKSMGIAEFLRRARLVHGDIYDYGMTKFSSVHKKINISCKIHGEFIQTAWDHLHGTGCPKCNSSSLEKIVRSYLVVNNLNFIEQMTWDWLSNKKSQRLDFYLPDFQAAIECQGIQHFEPIEFFGGRSGYLDRVERDDNKRRLCDEHNIRLYYFSNLSRNEISYEYPYLVYEDLDKLLLEIKNI
jgi:hypothetical protein